MDTALALVAAGMGVTILPEGVANRYRRVLRIQSLAGEKACSQIGIAVAADSANPLADNLIALARRMTKQEANGRGAVQSR